MKSYENSIFHSLTILSPPPPSLYEHAMLLHLIFFDAYETMYMLLYFYSFSFSFSFPFCLFPLTPHSYSHPHTFIIIDILVFEFTLNSAFLKKLQFNHIGQIFWQFERNELLKRDLVNVLSINSQ